MPLNSASPWGGGRQVDETGEAPWTRCQDAEGRQEATPKLGLQLINGLSHHTPLQRSTDDSGVIFSPL